MTTTEHIASLTIKYLRNTLSDDEKKALDVWLEQEENRLVFEKYTNPDHLNRLYKEDVQRMARVQETLFDFINEHDKSKMVWWRYAAAAILIFAIGSGIYYFSNQSYKSNAISGGTRGTVGDIVPGTNRAILTIDNNQNIDLAANKTGININNSITYNDGEKIADAGQMLELTTPNGGQYQAVLPDGSKVWLNAASSIKFPSKFNKGERRMEVTGEVFIEVKPDQHQPFFVTTASANIQVLGTSFNVSDYKNEISKISLAAGAIKVNNQLLKPGQAYKEGKIISTNIEQDLAWKNGLFNFHKIKLGDAMRQLARWYNIEVEFKDPLSQIELRGEIRRDLNLKDVLSGLEEPDLHFSLENQKLIISR